MTTTFTKQELKSSLLSNVAQIVFTKADGTERVMKCTLKPDVLPVVELVEGKVSKPENPDVLSVWDLENSGWRSFKINSVISVDYFVSI